MLFLLIDFQNILATQIIYIFILIFVIYVIGKPKWLIKKLNQIWGLVIKGQKVSFYLLGYFGWCCLYNIVMRINKSNELNNSIDVTGLKPHDPRFDDIKKMIFKFERGVFLYLAFVVFIISFIKFADVYSKRYELEEEIKNITEGKNKKSNQNPNNEPPEAGKSFDEKKND